MFSKVSRGTIAYDASDATSKIPFARTIALSQPWSLYIKDFHVGFSGDAHIDIYNLKDADKRTAYYALGQQASKARNLSGFRDSSPSTPHHTRAGMREIKKWMAEHKCQQPDKVQQTHLAAGRTRHVEYSARMR